MKKHQPGGQHFVVHEPEAKVVRQVFAWCLEGVPMLAIARRLNEAGILTKGSKLKNGGWQFPPGKWSKQTVKQMIQCRNYTGMHLCSGIEVPCPAIIDDVTWTAANARLEQNKAAHVGRPPANRYLLRTFLWCGHCGKRCTTFPNNGYPFYRCGNFNQVEYARHCDAKSIRVSLIEREAWEMVWSQLDARRLLSQARAYYEAQAKPDTALVASLRKEAARLRADETQILKMTQARMYTVEQGQKKQREIWDRLRHIDSQVAAASTVVEMPPRQQAEAAVRRIRGAQEPETHQSRRDILEGIVELRMTYYQGELTITGKIPMCAEPAQADTFDAKTAKE